MKEATIFSSHITDVSKSRVKRKLFRTPLLSVHSLLYTILIDQLEPAVGAKPPVEEPASKSVRDHPIDAEMSNQGIGERAGDQESKKKTRSAAPRKSAKPDGAVHAAKQKVVSHGEAVEQWGGKLGPQSGATNGSLDFALKLKNVEHKNNS